MILISFYTKNTIYEKEIEDLSISCKALGIEHYIEARVDLGSWEKNCCQKPLFILECLERFKRPLLWVDADGIVLQKPQLDFAGWDMALYFNDLPSQHVRAATLYVEPTQNTFDFLDLWHKTAQEKIANREELPYGDQAILIQLLRGKKIPLKIAELPLEYTAIFDRDPVEIGKTVVLHFQASRTARMDPLFWQQLSGQELKAIRIASSNNN